MGHRRLGLFGPGLFGLITGQHRISVLFFGLSVVLLGLGWSPGFLLAQSPSVLPFLFASASRNRGRRG
jgi:hypothetical protein